MTADAIVTARQSYAFFVFVKGGAPGRRRLNTFEDALAEAERLRSLRPGDTFIIARELLRASPKDQSK